MASIYSSTSKGWKLRLDWAITGQSIANNRSTISLDLWVYDGTGYSQNETANEAYYIIQGEKRWNPYNYSSTGWYKLGSKSITVNHNADGTGSVKLTAEWDCGFASDYTPRHLSLSKTVTLTTIPRASSASATGNTLGETVAITISRASSSFTHKLYYTCGSISNQLIAENVGTSYSWTPPVSLAQQAPNAATVAVTLTVKTYNGSTYIGAKSTQLSLSIPSSIVPTLSVAISDPTGVQGTYGGYVQLRSKIQVAITAAGAQGSSIKSYSIKVGNFYTSNASSGTTDYLPNSGALKITCTVTDSRGRTASQTQTITVLAYSRPTIAAISAARCNQDGAANRAGTYGKVTFSASITPLSNINTASYAIQYREVGADSWSTADSPSAGDFAPADVSVVFPADKNKRFEVRVVATDAFESIGSSIRDLPAAYALYHLAKHLISVGIGRLCDKLNAFQVGLDSYFDKNVQVDGTLKAGTLETTGAATFGGDVSGTRLRSTAHSDLGAAPESYPVFHDGWLYSRTPAEMREDLKVNCCAITVCPGNQQTLSKSAAIISCGTVCDLVGTKLSISSDGGVVCSANGHILISASSRVTGLTAGDRVYIRYRHKSNDVEEDGYGYPTDAMDTVLSATITPILRSVQAGDIIYLIMYNSVAARGNIAANESTYLTVQYIDQ